MPRKPRPHFDGAVYHVFNRGNNKQAIFLDEKDYQRFLDELDYVQSLLPFTIYAFCLMPNHFHLALKMAHIELNRIMQALQGRYANIFNRRWDRVGHLFQSRFKAKLCLTDAYLIQMVSYIHYNPVAAKLVGRAEDWPWSSHAEYLGAPGRTDSRFPLSLLGTSRVDAVNEYLARLDQAPAELQFDEDFERDEAAPAVVARAGIEELAADLARQGGISIAALKGTARKPPFSEMRLRFAVLALNAGHRPAVIAAYLGRTRSGLSKLLSRAAQLGTDSTTSTPGTT